ncbi:hypothetical protein Hbl1158_06265 [Halobaculum sp. CBA1158]|uniref:hypothetical protein n=1 Tax=Halobaculum sp. CBA1158 TaxID=2904243 RepID=UPI001F3322EF|nr:hypothetical protein [Halobaculum sp. CBA1158]UIP00958.1 hypothetical protein Hbl1158_06265 [Halobaculum sp. CBA1158]
MLSQLHRDSVYALCPLGERCSDTDRNARRCSFKMICTRKRPSKRLVRRDSFPQISATHDSNDEELGLSAYPATSTMHIPRLASDLDCPERIQRRARTLAEADGETGVTTGVHPAGFAAVCLCEAGPEVDRRVT